MKSYQFEADEFAKLFNLLAEMVGFHHQKRSEEALRQFSSRIYPLLREVNYKIVGGRISESQHIAISQADPWSPDDLTQADAIDTLTAILCK